MKLLENKKALITGASRGIGRAIAIAFAQHGADVAISDLKVDDDALNTVKEIEHYGVKAKAYASDASMFEAGETLINDVMNDFGRIDVLVNNAGITRDNLLLRMSEQDWDLVIKVNLKSIFNLTKAVQRVMLKQHSGSIINMSSVVGLTGNVGQSNYSASKAGLIGFTKSIAQEFGLRGVRCNAIAPGFIETAMTGKLSEEVRDNWIKSIPLRRPGKPDDVANIALFLASDLSSYVTGQVISVDGGMHM
ncbi:MAG TPA: 3-oxoacyl-[acyl-carrier-protein] reductase [Bacteroidales bacterium]|nr:3-oxoacyl-[acyl-carrier-protein] reductase [Bacteroidales bacterium]HPR58921.1 3-oxoacyl-[acyl-carrier-protein] reductase [Bacteroidales bacterium]HRW97365.1 3-oxoacyl-[acyl-carrier-protein] reductase [Bacteroidales bacterium]